jgi:tetratricopeptide (TPR) repeat protein
MDSFSRRFIVGLLLITLGAFVGGCTDFRARFMANSMVPIMYKMDASTNRQDDVELMRDALPYTLVFLDGLIEASPDNTTFLLKAAEANTGYAFAFVEDEDPQRAKKFYLKARKYALRTLAWNTDFIEALDKPLDEFTPTLQDFDIYDVPALYWTASSWLSWISQSLDNPQAFVDLPKAEAIVKRILELDERYYYGMPHVMMGTFYAAPPKILGGNPVKAKEHYDRAFEISESKFLVMHVMYAKFYAYQIQDRDLFVETLQKVIDAPDDILPEKILANQVAKMKARALLEDIDEYF